MARQNAPTSRSDDMPRQLQAPVSLTLPAVAEEFSIDKATWLAVSNLFPGAQDNSIIMAIEYCKARGLDILKKPVHIVPMYVEDKATGKKSMRDVIMPGITEMRTTAARTSQYAGQDPAVLGKTVPIPVTNNPEAQQPVHTLEAPEFATVTVYRLTGGKRYAYSHTEYFVEAVARDKNGKINSMWTKRPRGQLVKCAEAGALRKAFPEELGGEYSADEMAGQDTFVEPAGLPEQPHGASGIAEPEAIGDVVDAEFTEAVEVVAKPEVTPEPARASTARNPAPDASEGGGAMQADPRDADLASKPVATPAQREAVKEQAREAVKQEAAEGHPAQQAAGEFKITLPPGAAGVLAAQMAAKGVTSDQLLAKLGGDVTTANINQALGLLKGW